MYSKVKLNLLRFLCATVLFALTIIIAFDQPSAVNAANPAGTAVGVIRWDAQVGPISPVGLEEERAMAPNQWHFRLPFYGTEPTANSDTMRGTTQAIMDQEIAYAKDAGINYWAFDWYPPGSGLETQRNLYLSSTHKNDVNWSVILFTNPMSSSDVTWLVTQFQTSNYQKVAGGRPLVYAFDYPQLVDPALIASLRSQTYAAMGVQPYIVALDATVASQIGADAISSYVTSGSDGQSYSSLASSERSAWDSYKNSGYKVIPWVTQGWDPRPRIQLTNPPYQYASYAPNSYITPSTPAELSTQLQSAIDWNVNNASSAPANAVLMYAWNEFSEGGYICPTLIPGTSGINRDYLDAIKNVTTNPPLPSGTSFVTGKTLSSLLRNDFGDYVGMKITVGSSPITVNQLGRYYVSGNNGAHTLKIVNASNADIAVTSINMGTGTADSLGFKYAALSSPITLSANTSYYIVSSETVGGDQWYNNDTVLTSTSSAVINAGVYKSGSTYVTNGSTGNSYVPMNFKTTITSANLALGKSIGSYTSSSNWDASQTADKAFDGSNSTNWQAASGSTFAGQWLQVDLGASTTFDKAVINEYSDNRTSGYRIEYWNGSSWLTAYTGTTIGSNKTVTFPAVTGSKARIYFTSGLYTPIIYEFEIYNQGASAPNLALGKPIGNYTSSSNWDASQTADKAFDGSSSTNWQAASGSTFAGQWLQADLGANTTFDKAVINEYLDNRTSGYRIEYWNGSSWQTAYTGTTIGPNKTVNFPAVTGSKVRIYFTSGLYTPIIIEFEIYNI